MEIYLLRFLSFQSLRDQNAKMSFCSPCIKSLDGFRRFFLFLSVIIHSSALFSFSRKLLLPVMSSWVSVTASRRISLDDWGNHWLPSHLALWRKNYLFSTCSFGGRRPEGRWWWRWVIWATDRIICAVVTHSLVAIVTGSYLCMSGFYPILWLSKG